MLFVKFFYSPDSPSNLQESFGSVLYSLVYLASKAAAQLFMMLYTGCELLVVISK